MDTPEATAAAVLFLLFLVLSSGLIDSAIGWCCCWCSIGYGCSAELLLLLLPPVAVVVAWLELLVLLTLLMLLLLVFLLGGT